MCVLYIDVCIVMSRRDRGKGRLPGKYVGDAKKNLAGLRETIDGDVYRAVKPDKRFNLYRTPARNGFTRREDEGE